MALHVLATCNYYYSSALYFMHNISFLISESLKVICWLLVLTLKALHCKDAYSYAIYLPGLLSNIWHVAPKEKKKRVGVTFFFVC